MQKEQNNTALVWFKNDLRTQDNYVLHAAIENHDVVLACYCFDPRDFATTKFGFKKTEKFRAKFLIETVKDLKQNLKKLNIELFVYFNKPEIAINELVETHKIQTIYFQKEWTAEELSVINQLKKALPNTIKFNGYYNQFLYRPEDIRWSFSQIPMVFTTFRKHVEKHAKIQPELKANPNSHKIEIINPTKIPTLEDLSFEHFEVHPQSAFPFQGGETKALERLNHYFFETKKLGVYKKTRNGLVGTDYSSKFSPWLANGSISARTIYWNIKAFENVHHKNQSTYWLFFELIWRDYFKYIALKHGDHIFKISGIRKTKYNWETSKTAIENWINGRTNSAFVNANMVELKKTGWMSNRGRQNVASYFSKALLLDWRIGAAYFEAMLIDYDVHSNYGNWMYVSGVGNDPRDRKFNVSLQAKRYDANTTYQNLWLQNTLF